MLAISHEVACFKRKIGLLIYFFNLSSKDYLKIDVVYKYDVLTEFY